MRVELITGPPGSGKSTLALERMRRGDVLLDMDRLWVALSGLPEHDKPTSLRPVVIEAWEAARLRAHREGSDVVVVAAAPDRNRRGHALGCLWEGDERPSLTVLEVPVATCLARIAAQQRAGTTDWRALVEQWWQAYQRPGSDEGWATVEVLR